MGFSTDAIHAGQIPDPFTGAVITPLYLTTTYAQEELGVNKGFTYGRTRNVTREALEKNIAALEKGKFAVSFASGLAAEHALMGLLKSGDHVIASDNLYGGTYRLFEMIMKEYGIEFSWVDTTSMENIRREVRQNTRLLYLETPANPMLVITDLKAAADLSRELNILSVVDNTFMSPYFQNPLAHGIDIVLHSSTKYLGGHSDVLGGIIITNDENVHRKLRFIQNAAGSVPSPFDCWLLLRSTKTLSVRMKQHNANALAIAEHFCKSPLIEKVIYPGLPDHPHYELAKKQMTGFGGIISLDTGSFEKTKQLLKNLKIITLAESLGGVESLVCHPATMTHASVPLELRLKMGITDSLIRLSVGIEDVEDLIEDIENALNI
ncbi:MAG: trans-sulfuration enzyme family protein [Syntrophothermus sp.]